MKIHVRIYRETLGLLESKEHLGKVCVLCHELYYWQFYYKFIYLFIYCLLNGDFSRWILAEVNGRVINELEGMWKEAVMFRFKVLSGICLLFSVLSIKKIQLFYQQYNWCYPSIERYCALFLCSVFEYIKQQIWINFRETHTGPLIFPFRTTQYDTVSRGFSG